MSDSFVSLRVPLPVEWVPVLRAVDATFRALSVRYLMAGGNARELLLVHIHGCPSGRRTTDLDFGLFAESWEQFEQVKARLVRDSRCVPDARVAHRVVFGTGPSAVHVDLVPFGGVETGDGSIAWPPEGHPIMSTLGFRQAEAAALQLEVEPGLIVPIASSAGLVLLKLVAWRQSGAERGGRDAVDLTTLLEHHHQVLGLDALFDEHWSVLSAFESDLSAAGAAVLGQQVRALADDAVGEVLAEVLSEPWRSRLLGDMVRGRRGEATAKLASRLVTAFARGAGGEF